MAFIAFYFSRIMPTMENGAGDMPLGCIDMNDSKVLTGCATNVTKYMEGDYQVQ
jgi:hypothetical protein